MEAHLVKIKDDVLECSDVFSNLREDQVVPESYLIRGVVIAGTRVSQNGYTYEDKAFNTLAHLAEGSKVFFDHPSDAQVKATGGVRPVRDWAGVFHNTKKDGDRVYGDLYLRESAFPLFKDIVRLKPYGVGMSLNARVKVYKDNAGKESVVDIDKLHSIDAVSSASLCSSLFESVSEEKFREAAEQEESGIVSRVEERDKQELAGQTLVNFARAVTYHHGEMSRVINLEEGILANQMKKDEVRNEINEFIWKAADMVYKIIRDPEIVTKDKKSKIEEIMDDLDSEIQKRLKQVKDEAREESVLISIPEVKQDVDIINIIIPD